MNYAGDPVPTVTRACTLTLAVLAVAFSHQPAHAQASQQAPLSAKGALTIPPSPRKAVGLVANAPAGPVAPVAVVAPSARIEAPTPIPHSPTTPPSPSASAPDAAARPTLDETRLTLAKWIETQQIISKERNDWQHGKEIVHGRIELVSKEVGLLAEKVARSQAAVTESNKTRDELVAENETLKDSTARLAAAVTQMEGHIRTLASLMPEPIKARIAPLLQRIPVDPANTLVSTAERFQNVLGILNELNKANGEIAVHYEIRTLADGTTSEVQVLYVGLCQAYYLSPRGEAGIGRPGDTGWIWQPAPLAATEVVTALEILQGKHSPSFVPLPMKLK